MRVFYDGYIYSGQKVGGINRYFEQLINNLPDDYEPYLTTINTWNNNFPSHKNLKVFKYPRFGFRPGRISYYFEKKYFEIIENIQKYDVFHPTYYSLLSRHEDLDKFKNKFVLTVHDLIHEIYYPDEEIIKAKKKFIEKADIIICVSNNTKNDLMNFYNVDEDKVRVIYLGSEINILDEKPATRFNVNSPYFLFIGNRNGYKNFQTLIKSFSKAANSKKELKLLVVGEEFSQDEINEICDLKIKENIIRLDYVSDTELSSLYKNSICFVFPSFYEGFGLPAVEAMRCGTVTVASDSSSLREIVGDAGILFNPDSSDDLAEILLYLYKNQTYRKELIEKGYNRVEMFNWDITLKNTLDVYKALSG